MCINKPNTLGVLLNQKEATIDILKLNPLGLSLFNTALLLSSGISVTVAHLSITSGQRRAAIKSLFLTIIFGLIFLFTQFLEYN